MKTVPRAPLLIFTIILALGALASCGDDWALQLPGFAADEPGLVTISIDPNAGSRGELAFGPNPLVLDEDTVVTWVNNDTVAHTVTARTGLFNSPEITPQGTFQHEFTSSGAFEYYCRIHPTETGLIVIEQTGPIILPSPTASPSPSPSPIPTVAPTALPLP